MIRRLGDGVFAIAGAAGASQFPEFYRQYLQRLGGRLDQALVQERRIAEAAAEHGLTPGDYAAQLSHSVDPLARTEAGVVAANLADTDQLRTAYEALVSAGPLERPWVFARLFESNVADTTLSQYVPAVPLSPEALIYAAIGMMLGLMLLAGSERSARAAGRFIGRQRGSPTA